MDTPADLHQKSPGKRKRWCGHGIGLVVCGIGLLAFWSVTVGQFVMSPFGLCLALAAAVAAAAPFGITNLIKPHVGGPRGTHAPDREERIVGALVGAGLMGAIVFEATGVAMEFWTLSEGVVAERTMHLGAYSYSSRHNCAGFDLQEARLKFRRVVCADYRHGEAPPPGTPVVVRGPASRFGIDVQSFTIGAGKQAPGEDR